MREVRAGTDGTSLAEQLDIYGRSILAILAKHSGENLLAVLNRLAVDDPATYYKGLVALVPKNVTVGVTVDNKFESMSLNEMIEAYEVQRIENEQALAMLTGLPPGGIAEYDKHDTDAAAAEAAGGRSNKGRTRSTAKH